MQSSTETSIFSEEAEAATWRIMSVFKSSSSVCFGKTRKKKLKTQDFLYWIVFWFPYGEIAIFIQGISAAWSCLILTADCLLFFFKSEIV